MKTVACGSVSNQLKNKERTGMMKRMIEHMNARRYMRKILESELKDKEKVDEIMKRISKYSDEEIERVADAIDRFGYAAICSCVH